MSTLTHIIDEDLRGEATSVHASALDTLARASDTLIVSLAGVRAIDASGVALLMRLKGIMARRGKDLVFADVRRPVSRRLSMLGMAV